MPALKPPPLDIGERIAALRAELDSLIDEMAAKEKQNCPNVPLVVIRNSITARGGQCQCRQFLIATGVLK